ncbi:MAG: 5-methylcytosine-specific restriction endonuclease system specificity protein McrC [Chloroflexota bacterium]
MAIPIRNIYYLLCYAWDKLEQKDRVKVDMDEQTQLVDLFAQILISGTEVLLKRGIEKNYVSETVELAGVKGKLDLGATIKAGTHQRLHTICTVDEFSSNVLINQILVSTLHSLRRTKELDKKLGEKLTRLIRRLPPIEALDLRRQHFAQVRLHRNNQFYGFLLSVCEMLYEHSLPTENPGERYFVDFTRDEQKMNQLFEAFLRNFYKREFPHWQVRGQHIKWQFQSLDEQHRLFLPRMETDITIQAGEMKLIIDAKYYQKTMRTHYGGEKVYSQHLYQLFSYLMNQRGTEPATYTTKGMLVYPTVSKEHDLAYRYEEHDIFIKTVNLNAHWATIEHRLKEIVLSLC